jgi:hypothetical protein
MIYNYPLSDITLDNENPLSSANIYPSYNIASSNGILEPQFEQDILQYIYITFKSSTSDLLFRVLHFGRLKR